MDPVSTVITLITLSISIKTWLDDIKEKDSTITAISAHIGRVPVILEPFKHATGLEPSIQSSLLAVGDALALTKEHLSVWGRKRSKRCSSSLPSLTEFLDPSGITKQLKEDEGHLSQQIMLLSLSLTASSYFRDRSPVTSEDDMRNLISSSILNQELLEFWRQYIGPTGNASFLLNALKRWLEHNLDDEQILNSLIFRHDEFMTGGVSLPNLEAFIGSGGPVRSQFRLFEGARRDARNLSTYDPSCLPLIVWVDDKPDNNIHEVQFARSLNIKVIRIHSTALAKDWIEENEEFLRGNDTASRVRFISDNIRFEVDPTQKPHEKKNIVKRFSLGVSAGENIIQYLRGRLYSVPVLVYCGRSINTTQYVLSYKGAGSTIRMDVVRDYMYALAKGLSDDNGWKMFKAR